MAAAAPMAVEADQAAVLGRGVASAAAVAAAVAAVAAAVHRTASAGVRLGPRGWTAAAPSAAAAAAPPRPEKQARC